MHTTYSPLISAETMETNLDKENTQSLIDQFQVDFQENPRLLSVMAQICLNYRQNDVERAAERLGNYISWRRKVFGNLRDIRLREETKLREQLQTTFLQLSPARLTDGVGMICLSMKMHDPSTYSANDTMKCMHFFLITAMMEDPVLASCGFVFVNNTADAGRNNLDLNLPSVLVSSIIRCLPYRVNKILLVNPPWIIRFFLPIIQTVLPAKLLTRLHVGPPMDKIAEIVGAQELPTTLGGTVEFNTLEHIDRLLEEDWVI